MTQISKNITRRDFLRGTTCATLALAMGLFPEEEKIVGLPRKTKVVLIRDPDVLDAKGRINAEVIQQMLDKAVSALFEKKDHAEAWSFW